MNAMTPVTETELDFYRVLADPEATKQRAAELLAAAAEASATIRDAAIKKVAADAAMKAAADKLVKAEEMSDINTKKLARLTEEKAALADKVASHEFNKAADNKRLGEWKQELKAQADAQAEVQAELDRKINAFAVERAKHEADVRAAEQVIAKAERIKAASES
jgi:hypothetical protein